MTIEWNRVTWYSKLFAVVVFVAVFVIAFYFGQEYASIKQEIATDSHADVIISQTSEVTVGVGQTGRVGGLDITFNKFIQDSRCPIDVECIEAGAVNINVTLASGPHIETKNMPSDEVPYSFNEYQVSIANILPPRHSKEEIKPSDYKITFHVGKKAL